MKDTKTKSEQIFNRPPRRTSFLGPMVGKLPTSGGGGGQSKVIEIVESDYDPTKISENYLTYFTQGVNNGPFFKVGQIAIQMLKSGDHYDGEITDVSIVNGSLVFKRYNQTDIVYNPFTEALNKFYPVGTVYFSVNGNIDPNTEFGGVWLMIPDGWYIKSCDNVLTIPNIYLPASLPPVYGSGVWERNGKFGSGTSVVDGGFRILGNYAITGPSSQNGTTCPIVAFDAAWNTNYSNNPYREHGVMGEDGLVDVALFTCMVWVRQTGNEAKQKQIELILNEWDKQIEQCNKEISQAKAIISTNTQEMSMKKATITEEEKLAFEKENELQNRIVENRNSYIEKINKKIKTFKKLNGVK